MTLHWETRDAIFGVVQESIIPTHIVLDVGAGIQPQAYFVPAVHIIIEPFLPYIETMQKEIPVQSRKVCLNGTWDKVMPLLPNKSVDTIFALDVIEHFEKSEGQKFLQEALRLARKQVVIFTPLGLYPQEYDENDLTDRWGMQGGYWQSHRSGWEPADFDNGWEIFACKEFHLVDQHEDHLQKPHGAFWAIKTFDITEAPLEERMILAEVPVRPLVKYAFSRLIARIGQKFRDTFSGAS